MSYKIVRFFQKSGRRVIKSGVSLEEAMRHCDGPEASSDTCTSAAGKRRTRERGPWFDGFHKE